MSEKLEIWINGITGRVGREIQGLCKASSMEVCVGGLSHEGLVDSAGALVAFEKSKLGPALQHVGLVVDFSAPEANNHLYEGVARLASESSLAILIGTTGLSEKQKAVWGDLRKTHPKLRVLFAPNTSLGVLVTTQIAKLLTTMLVPQGFDVEVYETHHRHKKDAPSGTALLLAESVISADPKLGLTIETQREGARQKQSVGVVASRGGGVFGEHSVRFIGDHEEVCLSHRAFSRTLFAQGALVLGRWLVKQGPGVYELNDVKL